MNKEMTQVEQEIRRDGNYTAVPNGVAMERTTFWFDFSIAEKMGGIDAVRDTFKRAFRGWKGNIRYLTPLYVAVAWKGDEWYGKNDELSKVYYGFVRDLDKYIFAGERQVGKRLEYDNFNEDEVAYFVSATD